MMYRSRDKKKLMVIVGIVVAVAILCFVVYRISQPTSADNESKELLIPIEQIHTNCTGVQELIKEYGLKNVHLICDKEEINKTLRGYILPRKEIIEKFNKSKQK